MPKVRALGVPEMQRDLEDTIKLKFGNMLTAVDVGRFLGLEHHKSYEKWLKDVRVFVVNGRKRYMAADVAKKLYEDSL